MMFDDVWIAHGDGNAKLHFKVISLYRYYLYTNFSKIYLEMSMH